MVAQTGGALSLAEMLRVKGEILIAGDASNSSSAEDQFMQSFDLARRQSARSWELRTATSLASVWNQLGRDREARAVLAPVCARFDEGFETPDVIAATKLLARLA